MVCQIPYGAITKDSWEDRDVYIVGGGPSLLSLDFDILKDKFTIGVNDAALKLNTNVLFSLDVNWIRKRFDQYKNFPGEKYLAVPESIAKHIDIDPTATYLHRKTGFSGLSQNLRCVYGTHSGYGALNLAYLKRARKIILLGFDYYKDDGVNHWHGGYPWSLRPRKTLYETWARSFDSTLTPLNKAGIIVLNASLYSRIECYPKVEFHEIG